ncbi:MAG: isoaspartyl peptidase/L-asparaginase [Proteobacteria bacterium]|nr:isoaspartyl peptidase/L-asparaginase [Pseudomonadota bacterium]MBU1582763.1 isoaspartyl peptidase/L-asparaginase [Pseudomonadota bacterium]MBU2454199.1 isoaspartyl peptidase/L-asparaginase [Pseudomonadota bacterium]MBU2630441.1 isoaspartyl peptidase/L-asparaginase [Pseudomonadota bacterium]
MQKFQRAILTHGGSGSDPHHSDGPQSAAKVGMALMENGQPALSAVVRAVRYLEDDPRFNAGLGSQLRADGCTIQQDASCMTSNGQFGAVAGIEGIQNPVDLAQGVLLFSPHILLVGDGARFFAKEQNIPVMLLKGPDAKKPCASSCDTVGSVAFDGTTFAAALSSGGLEKAAIGRVGDVPLPGCGLFCGPAGAVACTGEGEFIALKFLAREVYGWLEGKMSADKAAQKAMTLFDSSVDIGLIILTRDELGSNARNGMAWSYLTEKK